MTQAGPLRWRSGAGWLVLSGSGGWREGGTGAIDAAVLGWADTDHPMAMLLAAGGSTADGEELLEYYADLGGPDGYVVPIFDAADAQRAANCRLLAQAGLIYVGDGPNAPGLVRALRQSPALAAVGQAFSDGASVMAVGTAAIALGAWVAGPGETGHSERGWGWVHDAIIEPHFAGTKSAVRLRSQLGIHPECLGLGVPENTALALGPTGRVETVGEGQVTVVLAQVKAG